MKAKNMRIRILALVILMLILAQAFNGSLSISAFEKLYVNSLISSYRVIAKDLQRNIESAVRFGKPLDKFLGINALFKELQSNIPDLDNVSISLPDGKVIYSISQDIVGSTLPDVLHIDFSKPGQIQIDPNHAIEYDERYHILLPIKSRMKSWVGTIDISFKESLINDKIRSIIIENLKKLGITTVIAAVILAVALSFWVSFSKGTIQKFRIYVIVLIVLGGAQAIYSVFNVQFFQNNYIEVTRNKAETLTKLLKDDIEYLLAKGIRINRLIKIDQLLSEIIQATPEIEDMRILNQEKELLYLADINGVVNVQKLTEKKSIGVDTSQDSALYEILLPVRKGEAIEGHIRVQLYRKVIGEKIKEIILDSLTVVIISLLFVVELLFFLLIFIRKQLQTVHGQEREADASEAYTIIRPAAFMFIFAADLSVSFLPLHMENLYEPILGLSKDIVIGLPISVEMFFVGISLVIAGRWMDKKGWQTPFLFGILLCSIGALLSSLAGNAYHFIASRGILGFGYGMSWMAAQGFIFTKTDITMRARGLSYLVAGIYAGSICGGAAGAMLAERIGYGPVFIVAMGIMMLIIPFVLLFMKQYYGRPEQDERKKDERLKLSQYFKFIFNRNIFSLLIFSSMPAGLTLVGFLYYVSPIYLNRIGTSQSNIGRALMVYGLFMIYLAPVVSRFVDRSTNKKLYIALSGVLGGIGMLVFNFYSGLFAIVLAIFMLSLASSFGFASQSVFALNLKITQDIGTGKAMGIYRAVERLGQVLGPICIGAIIAIIGVEKGITVIGAIYVTLTLLFILWARDESSASV